MLRNPCTDRKRAGRTPYHSSPRKRTVATKKRGIRSSATGSGPHMRAALQWFQQSHSEIARNSWPGWEGTPKTCWG